MKRINLVTITIFALATLIGFSSCKKKIEEEIRPFSAKFLEGTDTKGYFFIIEGNTMNIYKEYNTNTNRITVVIDKKDNEVLKIDGIIQKDNKIAFNTDMVNSKNKNKPAVYDIEINDFRYTIKIIYQFTNFDKAIELINGKRFVYYDFDITKMPPENYIDEEHDFLLSCFDKNRDDFYEEAFLCYSKIFGKDITYPSSTLPDITKSKENYVTFYKELIKKDKEVFNNYEILLDKCPFFLNFKNSNTVEVQHVFDSEIDLNIGNSTLPLSNYNSFMINENNQRVELDNYIDFNYTLEKLDDKQVILKIDDKHLCSLGKSTTGLYSDCHLKADKENQPFKINGSTCRTNKANKEGIYKGNRLVNDNYTNIIINTETGIISYEVDVCLDIFDEDVLFNERVIIYLKAE